MIGPLNVFQVVALSFITVVLVMTGGAATRRRITRRAGVLWILFWLASAAGIAKPNLVVVLAHFAGISRGVDLVLYVAIIVTFVAFFLTYLRFRRVDEQLTTIVRHLAIEEAARNAESGRPRR